MSCGNLSKGVFFTVTRGIRRAILCALGERDGEWHDVVTDLECGTERAMSCAAKFGAAEFDYWAGLSHDLGKFHLDFQTYLISLKSRRESDHSTAEQDRH